MNNSIHQLLSLQPAPPLAPLPAPQAALPYPALLELLIHEDSASFGNALRALAERLPFKTGNWPQFGGGYVDDWFMVEATPFKKHLYYCERGSSDLRKTCDTLLDLAYEIFRLVIPGYTAPAKALADTLHPLADQRLLLWLHMSSGIYHMYQVNPLFGLRTASHNVTWMCEELVRMGAFATPAQAFAEQAHVLKGLTLSGLPLDEAQRIYTQLDHG
jgi:hypothetical protein